MFVVALPPDATGTRRSSSSRRVARLKRAFGVLLVLAALVFVIDELIEQTGIVPQMEMSETSAAAGAFGSRELVAKASLDGIRCPGTSRTLIVNPELGWVWQTRQVGIRSKAPL